MLVIIIWRYYTVKLKTIELFVSLSLFKLFLEYFILKFLCNKYALSIKYIVY